MSFVDVEHRESWPRGVEELVGAVVGRIRPESRTEWPFDYIGYQFESEERDLRTLLSDTRLVGYHASRLLPHEIDDVLNGAGLRVLTEGLRSAKELMERVGCPAPWAKLWLVHTRGHQERPTAPCPGRFPASRAGWRQSRRAVPTTVR